MGASAQSGRIRPALWLALKLAAAAGLIWYLVAIDAIHLSDLARFSNRPGPAILAFLLILGSFVVAAWRWQRLLEVQGIAIGYGTALRITLIGLAASTMLPGSASNDVVRGAYAIRLLDQRRTRAVVSVGVDRVLGMMGLLLLGVIALVALLQSDAAGADVSLRQWAGWLLLALAAGIILPMAVTALAPALCRRFSAWQHRERFRAMAWQALAGIAAYEGARPTLLLGLAISLLCHMMAIGALLAVATALYPNSLAAGEYAAAGLIASLANLVPLTPGGLGIGEAAFDQVCRWFGDADAAIAFGSIFLSFRAVHILAALPGLVLIAINARKKPEIRP